MTPQGNVNEDQQSMHRETVAQYFSTRTKYWKDIYNDVDGACSDFMGFHMRRRRAAVLRCLSECNAQGGRVLDVGCGSGVLLVNMAEMGHQVYGVDIAPGMVEEARNSFEKHGLDPDNVQLGGIEKLPYEDNSFDVVTCVGVLEYVFKEEEALSEIKRILKKNGQIIFTLPNIFKLKNVLDPYYWLVLSSRHFFRHKILKKTVANTSDDINQISTNANYTNTRYSYRQVEKIIAASGLVPVSLVGLGYGAFTICRRKIFSDKFSIKVCDYFENFIERSSFLRGRYFPNRWVICLKKMEE